MTHDYLKRLAPEVYRGFAWVHWTMTIRDRRTGWLDLVLLHQFRERLAHVAFRYQVASPIYCLMPDHFHLLLAGLAETADQRLAVKSLRKELNVCLKASGYEFQSQPYDHVLHERELEREAIEQVVEYIARNPERKGLVAIDHFAEYPYTGCLLPGFPSIELFQPDSWPTIWRTISFLKRTEVLRRPDPMRSEKAT